jgi:hypothetical protein
MRLSLHSRLTSMCFACRSVAFNRLTELSINFGALTALKSLLLLNNTIAAVEPAIWGPLLANGFNLLDMAGNPSQCFAGLGISGTLELSPTVVCECAAGFVGKAAVNGQLASGCVARSQGIAQPPAVAVVGSTYVFSAPNASAVVPQLCAHATTSSPCCRASLAGNLSSKSIALQVFSECPLISNWTIASLPSNQVFFPSRLVAEEVAIGYVSLPRLQTSSVIVKGVVNQELFAPAATSPFASNPDYPSETLYQLNTTAFPGLVLDPLTGIISGMPLLRTPPTQLFLFQNNTVFNYSALLTVITLSVVECNDITCNSQGTCHFNGDPYDGMFSCVCSAQYWGSLCQYAKPCPAGLLGQDCQLGNPFVGTNDNSAIVASLFSVTGLIALVLWWSRTSDDKEQLSSRLELSRAEVSSMQRLWEIRPSELVMQDDIAAGSFGKVVQALWNDIPVAVKCLSGVSTSLDDAAVADFERECAFMKSVRHANIILFYGAGRLKNGTPFLVLELSERGSLRIMLEKAGAEMIAWERKLVFARDTALGMQHLHSLGCIHRDLKSGNLLVTQNYHIKVADFGTSKLAASLKANPIGQDQDGNGTKTMTKMVGTPLWMAPELLEGKRKYDNKVDVYAYGIVLFEILTQALPWSEIPQRRFIDHLTEAVLSGKRPTVPEGLVCADDRYVDLMEKCWAQQAQDRPSFRDVVGNPVFSLSSAT